MDQQPPYNPNNNRQRMPSAWQPAAPTGPSSLQAAAAGRGPVPPYMQMAPPPHQQYTPYNQPGYNPYAAPGGGNPYYRGMWNQQQHYYPPHMQQQQPPPGQQPQPPGQQQQPQGQQPPGQPQQPHPPAKQYQPPSRPRRALVITDKDGNPVDLTSAATKGSKRSLASGNNNRTQQKSDAGAKMREAALAALAQDSKEEQAKKKAEEEAKKKNAEEEAKKKKAEEEAAAAKKKKEEEEQTRIKAEAEEAARKKEAEEQAARKAAEEAKRKAEKEKEAARKKAEEEARQKAQEEKARKMPTQRISLRPGGGKPPLVAPSSSSEGKTKRHVYSKQDLLRFKEMDVCLCRPDDLPDLTIERGPSRSSERGGGGGGYGGGGGGRGSWQRGMSAPRRQSSQGVDGGGGGGKQWSRGQAPPTPKNRGGRGGGRGGYHEPPTNYKPLVRSENRWQPRKSTSTFVVAEKKVKSILNKMTKEKFERLSQQMLEIPLESYDTLKMMIVNVYEKAIDEPSFGDMYADLCVLLSQAADTSSFIHLIESDEERENGTPKVWRWSNDIGTSDSEVVGPFTSEDKCIEAAIKANTEEGAGQEPVERGERQLKLVSLRIRNGIFIKVLKHRKEFFTVYFPMDEAEECGLKVSGVFLTERECQSDANKHNSFRRSLLTKCEEEFNKQDIYEGWKKEKAAYLEGKAKMTESEQAEREEELDFRRMKIKKQMLGNIKFIGQLYKKGLLKEKIMRYCIASLLKLDEDKSIKSKNPEYKDGGDMDMDEEDHEAACNMFATIGKTIEGPQASIFMRVCFDKMTKLSNDKSLSARSRFMYKDLLELRQNRWEPRRKQEKAKTLAEIRKDAEREERQQQQQQQQQQSYGGRGGGGRGGSRGGRGGDRDYYDGGSRRSISGGYGQGNRRREPRAQPQTDEDGFTTIVRSSGRNQSSGSRSNRGGQRSSFASSSHSSRTLSQLSSPAAAAASAPAKQGAPKQETPKPAPFSKDKLERRVNSMLAEFVQDPSNTEELILSMDELSGTPDAGLTLVQKYGDKMMDCKDNERSAITTIISFLFKKNKLSSEDIGAGLMDIIEFIDSFVLDAPRAYEYLGDVLSTLLEARAVDIAWLCEQLEKTKIDPRSTAPEKVMKYTVEFAKSKFGLAVASSIFKSGTDKLTGLLGNDKWEELSSSILV